MSADWMRLPPTKQVMSNHHGLTKWAKATLVRIIDPAITRIIFSVFMGSGWDIAVGYIYECMIIF